jgi:hypothetical protein
MGETDCPKSSNIAALKFESSENPILDLKVGLFTQPLRIKPRFAQSIHLVELRNDPVPTRNALGRQHSSSHLMASPWKALRTSQGTMRPLRHAYRQGISEKS